MTLATHIRDKQSKITHPCLPLCPKPLLPDDTKLELWFPSGCTDQSAKITLCIVLMAVMILCSPAACLPTPSQHMDWISSLRQVLREIWVWHSWSTNNLQLLLKSGYPGEIPFPHLTYKLPGFHQATQPWLSLNKEVIFLYQLHSIQGSTYTKPLRKFNPLTLQSQSSVSNESRNVCSPVALGSPLMIKTENSRRTSA